MTDRAAIIARITACVEDMTAATPGTLAHDKPLIGQAGIDSLDLVEIAFVLEEKLDVARLDSEADWSIDKIADAVIAAMEVK